MNEKRYRLVGREVVEVTAEAERAWRERRHVGDVTIRGVRVSTVFLVLDHGHEEGGRPLLFETLVFGGKLEGEMERYSTYEEAEKGHVRMVKRVRKAEMSELELAVAAVRGGDTSNSMQEIDENK